LIPAPWIASANNDSPNPQQVLPLAKFALKAHTFGDLELAMTHRSICVPDFVAVSHVRRYSLGA
jgi:hypothetical protein